MLWRLPSQSSTAWQSVITSAGSGRTKLAIAKGLVTPEALEARTSDYIAGFHDEHGAHDHHGPHETL